MFPNDVLVTDSYVFVSDNQGNKVYRHARGTATASPFIISGLQAPNGMCWDWQQNRVLLVSYRSNSPVQTFDPESGVLSTAMQTTLDNCDGLAMDSNGALYISSWNPGAIHRLDAVGAEPAEFASGLSGPADFCLFENFRGYDPDVFSEYKLFCPLMNSNSAVARELPDFVVNSSGQCVYDSGGTLESYHSLIQWVTMAEMGLLGFEIWANTAENDPFVQITANPIAATNSNGLQHYNFSDNLQHAYFEIRMLTEDGNYYTYGPMEMEYIVTDNSDPQQPELPEMRLFPNPLREDGILELNMEKSAECELLLYDLRGRLLRSENLGLLTAGTYSLGIDRLPLGTDLATGTYLLCLQSGSNRRYIRLTYIR